MKGGGEEAADSRHFLPVAWEAQPIRILPSHSENSTEPTHPPSDSDGRRPLLVEGRTFTWTACAVVYTSPFLSLHPCI